MVDFGDTIFETQVKPEVPIVEPIRDQSGEMFASALSGSIRNATSIFVDPNANARKAAEAKGAALAEVTEYVNLLADARDQGVSTDELNRMLRVKTNQWVSNYPELTDDIFTQINKMTSDNGLAGNINRETPQEAGNRKRIEQAIAEGWDMTNPDSAAAYEQFEQNKLDLLRISQRIEVMGAEGKVATAQMKSEAIGTMHSLIKNGLPWANDQISKAYKLLETTTDTAARQAIIDKTKETIGQQIALINSTRTMTNNEIDTSYLTAGIEGLIKQFEDTATGASTLAAYETANKRVAAQYEAMIMSDPKTAALIMLDKASKFQDPTAILKLDEAKLRLWSSLFAENTVDDNGRVSGAKPGDVIDTPENVAIVFEELKNSTNTLLKDATAEPEAIAAQENKIINVLRSTARYGAGEQDAKNFTAVVDFLADPTIGRFIEQHGGTILPQVASEAKYVLEQQYDAEVIPLIQERWATAITQISSALPDLSPAELTWLGAGTPGLGASLDPSAGVQAEEAGISGVIEPVWNGVGVEFIVKDEYKQYAEINRIARDLNQGKEAITPAINKLIRMTAHLTGNTDYEKTYNEAYAPRLWVTGEEGDKDKSSKGKQSSLDTMTDDPSSLTLADLSDDVIKQAIAKTMAKDPNAMLEASNPTEVAKAYLGLSENNPDQLKTLSAFIAKSTGQNINPATTAWCAAFVDAVLRSSGGKGTGKLNARSYLSWGVSSDDNPQVGDIVILQRGSGGKNDWRGHVGFYMGTNEDGTIKVLGGNQGDSVSEADYAANKVLGFRRAG